MPMRVLRPSGRSRISGTTSTARATSIRSSRSAARRSWPGVASSAVGAMGWFIPLLLVIGEGGRLDHLPRLLVPQPMHQGHLVLTLSAHAGLEQLVARGV